VEHRDRVDRPRTWFPCERGQQIGQAAGAVRERVGLVLDVAAEYPARYGSDLRRVAYSSALPVLGVLSQRLHSGVSILCTRIG
jgi:hypothetical protein